MPPHLAAAMQRVLSAIRRRWEHLRANLSCGGRLHPAQPWALLPGPLLLLIALAAPYRWLFFAAYAWLLLCLGAYLWVRSIGPKLRLHRTMNGDWVQVGDRLEERWVLTNDARLPLLWLEIEDVSTLPGYAARRVAAVGARETQTWRTLARCMRRGVFTFGPLSARTGDPLGLFVYRWQQATTHQVVVYPPLVQLPPLVLPAGQRSGAQRADLLQRTITPSVGSVREYHPGDPPGRIHWPTVARTQRLMVKEFDQEQAGALWIVLDLYEHAYPREAPELRAAPRSTRVEQRSRIEEADPGSAFDSPLELAILLACSLAAQALAAGRAVGLLADDGRRRVVTPGHGPRQLWRVLSDLVDVQATGQRPLAEVLRGESGMYGIGIGMMALSIVTPDVSGNWNAALAQRRHAQHGAMALLVASAGMQTQALTSQLAALNIAAHTFEIGQPLPWLNPPAAREELRVSPTGRVFSAISTER